MLPDVHAEQMASTEAGARSAAAAGASRAIFSNAASLSSVWAMRVKCSDTLGGVRRSTSYSVTVFQDGTIHPNRLFHSLIAAHHLLQASERAPAALRHGPSPWEPSSVARADLGTGARRSE